MAKRTHGTPEQFLNALENKINELGGYDVDSATNVSNIPSKPEMKNVKSSEMNIDKERYLHNLISDLELDLEDLVQGFTVDYEDDNLYVTVETFDGNTREYKVPFSDLNWDFNSMDTDVAYISDHIAEDLDLDPTSDLDYDIENSTSVNSSKKAKFEYEDRRGYKYTEKELRRILEDQRDLYPGVSYENWIKINIDEGQLFPIKEAISFEENLEDNEDFDTDTRKYIDQDGQKYTISELKQMKNKYHPDMSFDEWLSESLENGYLFES